MKGLRSPAAPFFTKPRPESNTERQELPQKYFHPGLAFLKNRMYSASSPPHWHIKCGMFPGDERL
jgi:hypothetical protein